MAKKIILEPMTKVSREPVFDHGMRLVILACLIGGIIGLGCQIYGELVRTEQHLAAKARV